MEYSTNTKSRSIKVVIIHDMHCLPAFKFNKRVFQISLILLDKNHIIASVMVTGEKNGNKRQSSNSGLV